MEFEDSSTYDVNILIDILSEMVTEYIVNSNTKVKESGSKREN